MSPTSMTGSLCGPPRCVTSDADRNDERSRTMNASSPARAIPPRVRPADLQLPPTQPIDIAEIFHPQSAKKAGRTTQGRVSLSER